MTRTTKAVFFDVDFTLIYPGPVFAADGYRSFSERYGLSVDTTRFEAAVAVASRELEVGEDAVYRRELFCALRTLCHRGNGWQRVRDRRLRPGGSTRNGRSVGTSRCMPTSRPVLRQLHGRGLRLGLISNTHRCLDAFKSHFALEPFITGAVSSSDHGFMKPHPSIFEAALRELDVVAEDALMVGDSVSHDVEGARRLGMRAVLLVRSGQPAQRIEAVPVITSLSELPAVVAGVSATA